MYDEIQLGTARFGVENFDFSDSFSGLIQKKLVWFLEKKTSHDDFNSISVQIIHLRFDLVWADLFVSLVIFVDIVVLLHGQSGNMCH